MQGNISTVVQREIYAEIYVDYYAEDIYNGNKRFKQTITLQKMTYTDNKLRWTIAKMKNIDEPSVCKRKSVTGKK